MLIMIEIDTKDLNIGMYVALLDRPWLETSFLFQGFRIENKKQIEQLQLLCKTVKIDEEQSAPSLSSAAFNPLGKKLNYTQPAAPSNEIQNYKKRFEEEMKAAQNVYEDASVSLNNVLNNFRLNDYISVPEVKSCVQGVIGGIIRNPNALVLIRNLRSKQQDTATHSMNVCIFATLFGRYLAFNQEQLSQLSLAALLHDVGEAKLPKAILDRHNNELTPEEIMQMQMHTHYGAEMLGKIEEISDEVTEVAYSHHERIDGKGYPRGLKAPEISLMSRIIAIVDTYERVTNNVDLKMQLSCSDALKSIYVMRDKLFDGNLVESFIKCLGIYPVGSIVQLNNGAIGIVIGMKPDMHLLPTVMIVCNSSGENCYPTQVINLDKFRDDDGKPLLIINKVIEPNEVSLGLRDYIVTELGVKINPVVKLS